LALARRSLAFALQERRHSGGVARLTDGRFRPLISSVGVNSPDGGKTVCCVGTGRDAAGAVVLCGGA
jgi:hypothetical protein